MKMKIYKNCTFLLQVQLIETLNLKSTKYSENLSFFLTMEHLSFRITTNFFHNRFISSVNAV